MDRDEVQKRIRRPVSSHLDRTSFVNKGFIIRNLNQFFFRNTAGSPVQARCMAYLPSVRSRWLDIGQVLFCVFMDRDGVEVHKHTKKEQGQYAAILTEQTWSIKDLLYGFRGNFSCGTQRVVPSGQDSSIFPTWVANQSAGSDSSCPLAE